MPLLQRQASLRAWHFPSGSSAPWSGREEAEPPLGRRGKGSRGGAGASRGPWEPSRDQPCAAPGRAKDPGPGQLSPACVDVSIGAHSRGSVSISHSVLLMQEQSSGQVSKLRGVGA